MVTWGFPKLGVSLLGVPIIRTIVFLGVSWGSLILGSYHIAAFFVKLPYVLNSWMLIPPRGWRGVGHFATVIARNSGTSGAADRWFGLIIVLVPE